MTFQDIMDFFFNPKVALCIFVVFLVSYVIFLDEEGAFSESFLHFGPGTSEKNMTTFFNIKLDTWSKVGILYVVGFISSMLTTYYNTVIDQNIDSYIWNRAIKKVPYSKTWTYFIVILEPIFFQLLEIIQLFEVLTLQLQFIIPQFIGAYIAEVPFTIQMLSTKKFQYA
uniref:Uncharacterized protein n=1 Tax=viral metagenome TaxID=1070528 RepID=A0A6C0JZC1_9ZZZZ